MAFIRAEFMSESLKRIVPVTVVIPSDTTNFSGTGANPAKPPYKTLYLLHGIYGSDMDLIANTNLMRLARERQMAVVMPAGENHFYVDDSLSGVKYGEFIGREDPFLKINRNLHEYMDQLGIDHEFLVGDGGHNFDYWRKAVTEILDWLPHGEVIPIMDSGDVFGS